MVHNKNVTSHSWKDLPKLLIVLLAITLICLLFPSHDQAAYRYQQGQPWAYEDLAVTRPFSTQIANNNPKDSIQAPLQLEFSAGDILVRKGEQVTSSMYKLLNQYFAQPVDFTGQRYIYFLGYFLLTAMILGALVLFSIKYFPQITQTTSGVIFLVIWPVLFSFLVFLINKNDTVSPYLIPFCLVPIIVYNFYGGRLALFIHIVVVLIASFLSELGYEFTFLQILAGIVTLLVITETRYWNVFFRTILVIMLTYLVGYLGLALINSGSLNMAECKTFGWLAFNSLLLLLAYPFIPIVEKLFGFTSSILLAELADMNKPLLKELSIKAPGTLQHSLQVANLSEAAADKIGANGILVKTAALYHDIGKMKQPELYIENSKGVNHHEKLNNFESARIIIEHVTEGVEMAKKAKLPKVLVDFIRTHHGTTRVEYFYRNQLSSEPDREFDESLFRYPGPKPTTREETIMMIADSLEAACKSLKSPTGQDIDQLINKIIDHKIDNGQLSESRLTFTELATCKEVWSSLLRSINHVRIEYPSEVKPSQG